MSGQSVNRNVCVKHIPVIVNAIKKLEKRVMDSGVKQLVLKNITFKTNSFWREPTSDDENGGWQVSSSDATTPEKVRYNAETRWWPDEVCNELRMLMANNSIICARINIPINDDVLNELSAHPEWVNHYTAEYTNGVYQQVFPFSGWKWDFINFSYMMSDGGNVCITINVKSYSQRDQIKAAEGDIDNVNTGIQITEFNRHPAKNFEHNAFDFDGEQWVRGNGTLRMAIPTTPMDIIIEYRE